MEWRRANHVDEMLDWKAPQVLLDYLPIGLCGYDRLGGPGKSVKLQFNQI